MLAVPLQTVVTRKGKQFCYRLTKGEPVRVPVTVGLYNDARIQITEGLEAGDRVLLSPPVETEPTDVVETVADAEAVPPSSPEAIAALKQPPAAPVNGGGAAAGGTPPAGGARPPGGMGPSGPPGGGGRPASWRGPGAGVPRPAGTGG